MSENVKYIRKSMTGFGRGKAENAGVSVTVDAKSLNHRYLEIFVKLQKEYIFIEEEIRKIIKEKLVRGKIELVVNISIQDDESSNIHLNIPKARAYKEVLEALHKELDIPHEINAIQIAGFPDVIVEEERDGKEDIVKDCIVRATKDAMDSLCEMRKAEGFKLVSDLEMRAEILKKYLEEVRVHSESISRDYAEKLKNRVAELMHIQLVSEERLAQEVAIMADRAGITEEIVRLDSHISQLKEILKSEDGAVGKKIDFLVQEMNREANTIGSKSGKLEITKLSLDMKSEIEKIREQVQNLE